jgi:beta-hydroxyacyl-ACP dehydratase FabZ
LACYHADMSEQRAVLTAEQILKRLPHRFPFLLIDKVVELSADKVVAIKNVSFGEWYFQGHFPDAPVMPGVLQVEAMAQAGGILAGESMTVNLAESVMYFMTIDGVKFRRPVVPGDQLVIEVVPLRKGKIFKMKGECKVDGVVVSQAEFLATIAPRPKVT